MPDWNGCRWDGRSGHYESWFQRANHPTRPLAFWIRHTIFCPAGNPEAAQGEIWAVWFDGETGRKVAAKTELPREQCVFAAAGLDVKLGPAQLSSGLLEGKTGPLKWKLCWSGKDEPSLLLPPSLYAGGFPKAKGLTANPDARFSGTLEVDGVSQFIDGWPGSHNHNWGVRHTDRYTWAQVCGFDDAPGVFLECMTAQIKLGPVFSPRMTVAVLNLDGRRIELNTIPRALAASARAENFEWKLSSKGQGVEVEATVDAAQERFVALRYRNPPGGAKACLNTKLARCSLTVTENGSRRVFSSASRAAFEILCEEDDSRVAQVGGFSA
jgi:hypothetical protein